MYNYINDRLISWGEDSESKSTDNDSMNNLLEDLDREIGKSGNNLN